LFVYQVQPLDPGLTCCVVHVVRGVSGKGNHATITTLKSIAEALGRSIFKVLGYGFDKESCFNDLHDAFQ
jgi:hypothetical protein